MTDDDGTRITGQGNKNVTYLIYTLYNAIQWLCIVKCPATRSCFPSYLC